MSTLILGANSDIARSIAMQLKGKSLILASRNTASLEAFTKENSIEVEVLSFDALDFDSHKEFVEKLPDLDQVIVCFGYFGNAENARHDQEEASRILLTNFNGVVSVLDPIADRMEKQGKGKIIGIASVAGLRGRQSNYHYGAAKAGMIAYLSGLRNRLHAKNVKVITVLPGFVKTKMIDGLETPSFLTKTPDQVARRILSTSANNAYVGRKWWWVMRAIRNIPEGIFKRMKL